MNRVLLIIVALLCIPAFTESVQACECREYQTPLCARFWRSDAVFVGQVVDIKPLKIKPDNVYDYVMVGFTVQESFRGVTGPRVGVGVAVNTLCEPKFKKGKRYLVYASLNADTNQLFTGACRGTTLVDDDDDEYLDELRKLRQREVGESIAGRIVTNRDSGLAGIKVEVTNNEQTFTTLTSKDGDFSLSLPAGGSFKVRALVPYAVQLVTYSDDDVAIRRSKTDSLSTFEYDVKLEKSQCSYLVLEVFGVDPRATATVAGKVLDATGQAVDRGIVYLMNGVDTGPDYRALLEKDGSFRFRRVLAGEYHLVLNATHEVPQAFDAPHARTYYPGTEDKGQAKPIHVTEGAVIENLAMLVGQRLSERRVAGTVVWKSGRRLEFPYLDVYSGDEYVRHIPIKDDGRFECTLYGDFAYSIEAGDYTDEIEGRSQRIKLPPGDSPALKLVIERVKPLSKRGSP